MNVAELLAPVLDMLDRLDLEDRLMQYMPEAIRAVHSIQKFNRDKAVVYVPAPSILEGSVVLNPTVLPRVRDILKVNTYTAFGSSEISGITYYYPAGIPTIDYKNLNDGFSATDYYGFRYVNGYSRIGSNVTIVGVPSDTTLIEVHAMQWPSYEKIGITEDYETSSWIAEEYPQLIKAFLLYRGASLAQQAEMIRTAQEEMQNHTTLFLREFAGDIYNG